MGATELRRGLVSLEGTGLSGGHSPGSRPNWEYLGHIVPMGVTTAIVTTSNQSELL